MKKLLWIALGAAAAGTAWFFIKRNQIMTDPNFTKAAIAARAKAGTVIPIPRAGAQTAMIAPAESKAVWAAVESAVRESVQDVPTGHGFLSDRLRESAIMAETKKIILREQYLNKMKTYRQ